MPYIIAAIAICVIAIVVFLLSVRARIYIVGKNADMNVYLRILFYRYQIYPDKTTLKDALKDVKDKEKENKKKAKKDASKDAATISAPKKKKKKKRSILQTIRLVIYMLKRLYMRFPNHFHLRLRRLIVVVGGDDAANAAVRYGAVRAATSYLLTTCEKFVTFKTPHNARLLIEPNYLTDESYCDFKMDLSISLFSAVKLLYHAYPVYKAGKKSIAAKNKKAKQTSDKL